MTKVLKMMVKCWEGGGREVIRGSILPESMPNSSSPVVEVGGSCDEGGYEWPRNSTGLMAL